MENEANLIRQKLRSFGLMQAFERMEQLEKENDELHKLSSDLREIELSSNARISELENRLLEYEQFVKDKLPGVELKIFAPATSSETNTNL